MLTELKYILTGTEMKLVHFEAVLKRTKRPTRAGFKGSHTVSDALFVAGAETDSVTEGSGDVGVAERHDLQHLLDPRLQVCQQLL